MKSVQLAAAGLYVLGMMGCAMAQSPVNGAFYTDVKSPGMATDSYGGNAHGESCATSILGIVATGDASIDAAKKNGGVLQVVAVDHTAMSILGFYAKYCTEVYGKKGGSAPAPASGATPANGKPAG